MLSTNILDITLMIRIANNEEEAVNVYKRIIDTLAFFALPLAASTRLIFGGFQLLTFFNDRIREIWIGGT